MSPGTSRRGGATLAVVALAWLSISALLITMGWHAWPMLHSDSSAFVPASLSYALDGELQNPLLWKDFDPEGRRRFVHHGFLHPVVVGLLASGPSYASAARAMALLNCVALALCGALLWTCQAGGKGLSWGWKALLVASALLGLASFLIGYTGRPEPLVVAILAAGAWGLRALPRRWDWCVLGIALGVLGAAHPVGATLSALLAGAYLHVRHRAPGALLRLAGAGLLAASLCGVLVLGPYPYSLLDWLAGMRGHSGDMPLLRQEWPPPELWTAEGWFTSPASPLYGLLFLAGLLAAAWASRAHRDRIASPAGLWLFVALFGFVVAAFAVVRFYHLQLFAPLVYAALVAALASDARSVGPAGRRWAAAAAVALFVLTGAGFLRLALILPGVPDHATSHPAARIALSRLLADAGGSVAISRDLYTLTEDHAEVRILAGTRADDAAGAEWLVLQQARTRLRSAPEVAGYELVRDDFDPEIPALLGLKLGNSFLGYNHAVYRRIGSRWAAAPD